MRVQRVAKERLRGGEGRKGEEGEKNGEGNSGGREGVRSLGDRYSVPAVPTKTRLLSRRLPRPTKTADRLLREEANKGLPSASVRRENVGSSNSIGSSSGGRLLDRPVPAERAEPAVTRADQGTHGTGRTVRDGGAGRGVAVVESRKAERGMREGRRRREFAGSAKVEVEHALVEHAFVVVFLA